MKKYILYIIPFIALFASSCEDPINVDLIDDEEKKLVVNGSINNLDKTHTVTLTESQGYYNALDYPYIDNATLYIKCGEERFDLLNIGNGKYKTDSTSFKAEQGKGYTLHIELENGEIYEAYDSIREIIPIDSVFYRYEQVVSFVEDKYYRIFFKGKDKAGLGDCYLFNLYLDGVLLTDTLDEIAYTDDQFFDGQEIGYEGDVDIFTFSDDEITEKQTLATVEMNIVNQEYYVYFNEILQQTAYGGGMFSLPPANVKKTNIKPIGHNKEPLGYWHASAIDTMSLTIYEKQNIDTTFLNNQKVTLQND